MQDISGEKHQGVQGLPLGRGRHLALGGQVGEEALHIRGPKPVRMGLATVGTDIAQYLLGIGLLGAVGLVRRAQRLAPLIHQLEAGIRAKFRCILMLIFHNS